MEKTLRDWTLEYAYETDAGMLNSASINICTKNYTLVEPNFELTNFVLYPNRIKEISLFSLLVRQIWN
jgi:hypothetical protein